ncbi:hypothetical protein DRJ16_00025 [Candidatus Woesearchaeota archaeon]|nr:MAG: hypothetical protein DRJ16_00025 [Candidatus Woesearchaeota archaeon]
MRKKAGICLIFFGFFLAIFLVPIARAETIYSYWIEDNYDVYIKVDSIPASGSKTIYVQKVEGYLPDISNAFLFGDEFNGTSLSSGWNTYGSGTFTVSGGTLTISDSDGSDLTSAYRTLSQTTQIILETKAKRTQINHGAFQFSDDGTQWTNGLQLKFRDSAYQYISFYIESTKIFTGPSYTADTWYILKYVVVDSTTYYGTVLDENYNVLANGSSTSTLSANQIALQDYSNSGDTVFDWVRVRKYANPEPTVTVTDMGSYYKIDIQENSGNTLTDYTIKVGGSDLGITSDTESLKVTDTEPTTNEAPQYSNVVVSPSSPQTYPISNIWFNITWSDDGSVDKAWIVHNFKGENETVTMNNDTATHFYYKLDFVPAAGTYSYTFYANDTEGAENQTAGSYVINKASTTLHLAINGTEDNATYTYPSGVNVSAWNDNSTSGMTLYRNGSSVSNPNIVQLSAGFYNYTVTLNNENFTASPVSRFLTIEKGLSNLTMTASPGWDVPENSQVTITCTADLSVTLYKDGITVSNPYQATLPFGNYNFTCVVSDSQNYTPGSISKNLVVQPGGFGCTDTQTFAFKKVVSVAGDWINLDFSNLVENNLTRADLKDVYINTSGVEVYKNLTAGSYIIVNATGHDSIEVLFGNYIATYNYADHALTENTTVIEDYEEINPYYVLTLVNEVTGTRILPPSANTTMSLYCIGGYSSFEVDATKLLVASFHQLQAIRTTVSYSATEIYYRDYIVRSPVEYRNVYLVDANQYQMLQITFKVDDRTGRFKNSVLKAKKYLEGSLTTITESQLDIEQKAITFLINGDKYLIYLDNGDEERALGYVYTDPTSLEKNIILQEVTTYNISVANTSYALTVESGSINFVWHDPSEQTNLVELWVWNATQNNNTLLFYANSTNRSVVNFVYLLPNEKDIYKVKFSINHDFFGNNSFSVVKFFNLGYVYPATNPFLAIISALGGSMVWFVFLFIAPIPMVFTKRHVGIAALVLVAIVALFWYWKMWTISVALLGIGLLLAILIEIQTRRRWKE